MRGSYLRHHRGRALRLLLAATACVPLAAAPQAALAGTYSATCATLQSEISSVGAKPNHGEGDVIVLEGLCNAASLGKSSAVTLPAGSAFTLQGAPGTTSGIDGAGMAGPLLTGEKLGAVTIAGLVFQNDVSTGSGPSPVNLRAARVTLTGDSFLGDSHEGVTGGALTVFVGEPPCPAAGGPPALTVTDTTFRNDTNAVGSGIGAGGAAFLLDDCSGAGNVLERNVFEGNALRANGSSRAVGGGLLFASESKPGAEPLSQAGNVFAGNSIVNVAGTGSYGGGGEWLEGISLTSVGDRFTANTIPGTSGPFWSWGAGVGLLACSNTEPSVSALENAVIEGNVIGPGEPADIGGAGLYVGCVAAGTPNHLSLLDSTVTENSVPAGAIAGVAGGPHDQLRIANSIVAADAGGSETGGFAGEGGLLAASFSDVCNAAVTAPLAGEGNICANPRLADNGNPGSFDVHETGASPTIDAGSNTLVPAGLATDFYGAPRIQPAHAVLPPLAMACPLCGCSYGYTLTGGVDMGASELGPVAVPAIAVTRSPCGLPPSQFSFPDVRNLDRGRLQLRFGSLAAGGLSVIATFELTRTVTKRVHGHRHRVKRTETISYGRASLTTSASGSARLTLAPTRRALSILRSRHRLKVALSITFTQAGHTPTTQTRTIAVIYKAPKRARHR